MRPDDQRLEQLRSQRSQRTQPALPGASASTATISGQADALPLPQASPKKRSTFFWAVFQLVLLGLLLELFYLAFYPLLAFAPKPGLVLPAFFSPLAHFSWHAAFPSLAHVLARFPGLDPAQGELGRTSFWLLLLALTVLLSLLAMLVAARVQRARLSSRARAFLFGGIFLFAALFSLTLALAPLSYSAFSRDLLLYGLYGRMVTLYHVNPYVVLPTTFSQDLFQHILDARQPAPFGPVWLDISMLTSLFAQNNLASSVLTFRLVALSAHLLNCLLLWSILGRVKPELRLSGVVFYAWNPLVLVLGVAQMHQELVLVLFLLLAVFFFLYGSSLLSWVFTLLAALCNPLYLLVLPLFLLLLARNTRSLSLGRRLFWWPSILLISALIVLLAYLPYWPGWGFPGALQQILQVFWPGSAQNSLDAALLHLPLHLPAPLLWILAPHHWSAASLVLIGCFLLFGLWLADTLAIVLFFSCWTLLLAVFLLPVYWPWFLLGPLTLALACANRKSIGLAVLLVLGALLCLYCWQWQMVWAGMALVCLALPAVLWGWALFFSSTWQMVRVQDEVEAPVRPRRLSRPPWLSRPSWPSRSGN